ncbi:MAG: ribosome assembly cofactor RimP [Prevotellaceae bacterium]|jgi:ribosome maturation factor RimP|nr:ribosome assembly cofactor RimP [Prevotellaceae bacterium]
MIDKNTLIQTLEAYLKDTDYYPVDLKLTPDNKILVEIDAFQGVSVDFCAALNKHIETVLAPDIDDYELEISSAGLTSPFKVLKQYEKNIGQEVETLTKEGQKITGILLSVNPAGFVIQTERKEKPEGAKKKITVIEEKSFTFGEIKSTKYLFRFK